MIKGFIKRQEVSLALKLLRWKYQQSNTPVPPPAALEAHAEQVVDEAHRIARNRGQNVMGIIKELVEEVKKKNS
jgi:hypothetical protein